MDKPAGKTSHDVVQHVRRVLGIRAAGHTGTLDPFATGLLIVLIGRATRLARFVEVQPKTYFATGRLGRRTTTDDLTGDVIGSESSQFVPETLLRETLEGFLGTQSQRPPQFSAKRVDGERSYRKARRGEPVELADVSVTVHGITLLGYRPPEFEFRVTVSAGTYIRAIARDLGDQLRVGGHLTGLRREAIGSLRVEDAVPLDQVSASAVVPARLVLGHLPSVDIDQAERKDVAHGRPVVDNAAGTRRRVDGKRGSGEAIALIGGGELVAVAKAEDGLLRPTVVLESP